VSNTVAQFVILRHELLSRGPALLTK